MNHCSRVEQIGEMSQKVQEIHIDLMEQLYGVTHHDRVNHQNRVGHGC